MTQHKHLKQHVRARMAKTGERYAAARRHVVAAIASDGAEPWTSIGAAPAPADDTASAGADAAGAAPLSIRAAFHYPGSIPATTALRSLLAAAGVRNPATGEPLTEAMLFGIAGGIGIGVFAFYYEKDDFASFFIAGRHRWQDDEGYLTRACDRLGVAPTVREDGGAKAATAALEAALAGGRPVIAWVDAGSLPHRAMPEAWRGGGYHVVTVHGIDEATGTAWIGDLADDLVPIALADLAAARARTKKQKHRLLTIEPATGPASGSVDLAAAIRDGLRASHEGLTGADGIGTARSNFSLATLETLAKRMHGGRDKDRWERVFARGPRLWTALTSLHDFVEHYGTGGGLSRPLFADFLAQAGVQLDDPRLADLGRRYEDLGAAWSALADAALPDDMPLLAAAKEALARKAELLDGGGTAEELGAAWRELDDLAAKAGEDFPLDEAASDGLRAGLAERVRAIHADEVAAHAGLGEVGG